MYGISDLGAPDASRNNILITVNTTNGSAMRVGPIGYGDVYGLAYANGTVLAFTYNKLIQINPTTGAGTLIRTYPNVTNFYGAGVTPLVPRIG
jgi:hypothetical protein